MVPGPTTRGPEKTTTPMAPVRGKDFAVQGHGFGVGIEMARNRGGQLGETTGRCKVSLSRCLEGINLGGGLARGPDRGLCRTCASIGSLQDGLCPLSKEVLREGLSCVRRGVLSTCRRQRRSSDNNGSGGLNNWKRLKTRNRLYDRPQGSNYSQFKGNGSLHQQQDGGKGSLLYGEHRLRHQGYL